MKRISIEEVLLSYMEIENYNETHLDTILTNVTHKDEYIRELAAELLINFP